MPSRKLQPRKKSDLLLFNSSPVYASKPSFSKFNFSWWYLNFQSEVCLINQKLSNCLSNQLWSLHYSLFYSRVYTLANIFSYFKHFVKCAKEIALLNISALCIKILNFTLTLFKLCFPVLITLISNSILCYFYY